MANPVRVAMIIQAYYPHLGGAERQLAALAPLLRDQGVEPIVLTRRYPGLSSFESVRGVPVYRLPIPGNKATASLIFTLSAAWLLRRLKPDLIHAHELLSPATTAIFARRLYGTPVTAKVLRGGEIGDIAKLRRGRFAQRRIRALRENVDAFIVISEEIDRELAEIGIPAERRTFIPNGVDTRRFAPLPAGEKDLLRARLGLPASPVVVYSGRLVPEKRVDWLVGMWPKVRVHFPEASLVILGDGPEAASLRQQSGEGVRLVGMVEDVAPYLQAADLFALPSAVEGLSNALLEAMASGLPVVATAVGGAPDLVRPGLSGLLVPPNRPEQFESSLLTLLYDPAVRETFGQRARQLILDRYSLPQTASNLRALYDLLLSKNKAENPALKQIQTIQSHRH